MSSNVYEAAFEAMEFQEFGGGGRIILPESFYPARISVMVPGSSQVREDGTGGTPFIDLSVRITDGPFKDTTVQSRMYLSPGLIGFLRSATKTLTKTGADYSVNEKFGFNFSELGAIDPSNKDDRKALAEMFKAQFYGLSPEQRLDYMLKHLRINQWDGKNAIVKFSIESNESDKINPATGTPYVNTRNRIAGFFDVTDAKNGLSIVKTRDFPAQQAAIADSVLVN